MISRFIRIGRIKGRNAILVAARHNLREIVAERAGNGLGCGGLNRVLLGASQAADVAKFGQDLLAAAGIVRLRKDAVRALEVIISLPDSTDMLLQEKVFNESVEWAQSYFGAPILSAIVHRDEGAPHCHLIILPLVDGRMNGSALYGYRSKLRAMLEDFDTRVGRPNGLVHKVQLSALERQQLIAQAFAVLQANSGLQDEVLVTLLKPHYANPVPLAEALRLSREPPQIRIGEFVRTMTKPIRASKAERGHSKLAGVDAKCGNLTIK